MPPVMAIGTAIAEGFAAGGIAGAVGGAATGISTAVGGLTLSGLAAGANIVGSGLSLIGMATGNKTLSKIGMGFSIAGGIGSGLNMAKDMLAPSAVRGSSSALLNSSADDLITAKTAGATSTDDMINAQPKLSSVPDQPNIKMNPISGDPSSSVKTYDPETVSTLKRINDTLTKYSMPMNMLGGMGEAYMLKQQIDQNDRMQKRNLQFQQNAVDRRSQMPGNFQTYPSVTFNPTAYNGLLRTNYATNQ